ncbi:MAG: porin [Pseudomonadota bacterium]
MSKIKSLILGSAAGLVAIAGAQAADLPVKAKAVQYVKICSLYGAGFYYMPGTDTCIKFGGYVQLDATIHGSAHHQPAWNNTANVGQENRTSDQFVSRVRAQFNVDTRTATEYGVVRTYWASNFQHTSGDGPSSGVLTTDLAFIQFAGFTFGKAISGFQTPWGANPVGLNTSNLLGGYDNSTGINQIAYTWQFGNGLSAQLGVEDNKVINRAPVFNASASFTGTAAPAASGAYLGSGTLLAAQNGTGGQLSPDIVGNMRYDSSAFTAQISAATNNVNGTYYATGAGAIGTEFSGHPNDTWGFAVAGGIQIKNLPTGPGDKLSLDFTYTDGAPKYVIGGTTGNAFNSFQEGAVNAGSYQSFASVNLYDGVYANGGQIEKTKAWGFRGGYEHNWTKEWQTSVFGSYSRIDYNANASTAICVRQAQAATANVGGFANGYSCNPDFNIWQVGSRTAWTPVRNLTFSGEVLYTFIDQANTGSLVSGTANSIGAFKPAATYDYKDQGVLSGNMRVRRTF